MLCLAKGSSSHMMLDCHEGEWNTHTKMLAKINEHQNSMLIVD